MYMYSYMPASSGCSSMIPRVRKRELRLAPGMELCYLVIESPLGQDRSWRGFCVNGNVASDMFVWVLKKFNLPLSSTHGSRVHL